ncbi:hypothetical protein XA68_15901 [Ophiocordyceps unilateralis]|uniref:Uncharacterized protein n=1 Tax=Ophiocordyceps unilateralis TaxID=268505 RepID=A0A2A9PU16_OPHUN|nr:hypothetical protein XA68_15901 [Ophiocordyceps unilateralis]
MLLFLPVSASLSLSLTLSHTLSLSSSSYPPRSSSSAPHRTTSPTPDHGSKSRLFLPDADTPIHSWTRRPPPPPPLRLHRRLGESCASLVCLLSPLLFQALPTSPSLPPPQRVPPQVDGATSIASAVVSHCKPQLKRQIKEPQPHFAASASQTTWGNPLFQKKKKTALAPTPGSKRQTGSGERVRERDDTKRMAPTRLKRPASRVLARQFLSASARGRLG